MSRPGLKDGSFGMAEETGRGLNDAFVNGMKHGWGMGEAVARALEAQTGMAHPEHSIILAAHRQWIPVTVHAALGAEIIHQHPAANGAAIGDTSHRDFRRLAASCEDLHQGGVVLNLGSAVIMPEVFLKALTVARNVNGGKPTDFTTADFDMQRHYRRRASVPDRSMGRSRAAEPRSHGAQAVLLPVAQGQGPRAAAFAPGELPAHGPASSASRHAGAHLKQPARHLHVCEEAHCPNVGECWEHGTATFMILGDVCTRNCAYCAVSHGRPPKYDPPSRSAWPRPREDGPAAPRDHERGPRRPPRLRRLGIFAETIRQMHEAVPGCSVEVLVPDFQGNEDSIRAVLEARPEIYNHNTETVPRLYKKARPGGRYERVLEIFRVAKRIAPDIPPRPGSSSAWARPTRKSCRPCATCARWTSTSSRSASTCARRTGTSRSTATSRPTSSAMFRARAWRWASATSSPARWCAPVSRLGAGAGGRRLTR
jgi:hypothetical protein